MAAAIFALTLLTGCGLNGDFGRMRTSLQSDVHAWLGPVAYRPPPWKHQLTDEERRLRDYAYPLIDPSYQCSQWYTALRDAGLTNRPWPYPDQATYASKLFQMPYRSQPARYTS